MAETGLKMWWGQILKWGVPLALVVAVFAAGAKWGSGRTQKRMQNKVDAAELDTRKAETKLEGMKVEYNGKIATCTNDRDEAITKANKWSARVEEAAAAFRELEEQKRLTEARLRARLNETDAALTVLEEEAAEWRRLVHGPQVFGSMEELTAAAAAQIESRNQ